MSLVSTIEWLVPLIIAIETGGDNTKIGAHGETGVLQIQKVVVDDVNRILKSKIYTYDDRTNVTKAREIFVYYLSYYGRRTKDNENEIIISDLARIWNGGPRGYQKQSTIEYWSKLEKELRKKYSHIQGNLFTMTIEHPFTSTYITRRNELQFIRDKIADYNVKYDGNKLSLNEIDQSLLQLDEMIEKNSNRGTPS